MKYFLVTMAWLTTVISLNAQNEKYLSLAVYNTQNAMPFGKFSGLFSEILHPGIEFGYGKIFSKKEKHEFFGEVKLSYFYHRFVQHGIPLYLNFGYRRKIVQRLSADASFGLGYMHSIPAAGKYKLNSEGEYENNKGAGRMQATASFGIGLNYVLNPASVRPVKVFAIYQQRVQMPFVKSYVPLLPYNSFMIGASRPIKKRSSSSK
jgi:hypothetical protein